MSLEIREDEVVAKIKQLENRDITRYIAQLQQASNEPLKESILVTKDQKIEHLMSELAATGISKAELFEAFERAKGKGAQREVLQLSL